ncbi:MAG: YidC/Oxa1 family membrane protein insertase [Candidatus Eremiobacteraeota bacterium]|nr:YidC/Oxa1 family membrane protein insertase [Candidatus Eremiobacteraeota bacterium]
MHFILASNLLLDPIVHGLSWLVATINAPIRNLGLSLVILALLFRAVFWGLNAKQFKSMMAMQKIAPQIKKLQEKYKGDQAKIQQETMALYKSHGANPLTGCLPMLIQYPFIISVFYMVLQNKGMYENQHFAWIGSALSTRYPHIFATSLAHPDVILLVLYALSMYVSVRFGSMPATDPQQAQTQKIMAIMSPLMLGFLGYKYGWPSAMVLYWFASNLFQMGQQIYMLRRAHEPLAFIDSEHVITDVPAPDTQPQRALSGNGTRRRKNKKTKGARS